MVDLNDNLAHNSGDWYQKFRGINTPFDVHLCGYVQILQHMAKWRFYLNENEDDTRSIPTVRTLRFASGLASY